MVGNTRGRCIVCNIVGNTQGRYMVGNMVGNLEGNTLSISD